MTTTTKKKIVTFDLLPHQYEFVTDVTTRYIGLVGGFGCGKTLALCVKALNLAQLNVKHTGVLLEPTNTMVRDVLVPTMDELLDMYQIPYQYKSSPLPEYTIFFKHGSCKILLRSGENYRRLVGLNLAFFGLDEADTIENVPKAWAMWRVLQSRLRAGNVRQGFTTSTPEGYKFLYELFIKQKVTNNVTKRLIKGKTRDNPFLPDEYIEELLSTYPPQLIEAYLNGEFVNLVSDNIYVNFNRKDNHTNLSLKDFDNRITLHIGQDFNVGKCASIIHVVHDGLPIAVDEIMGAKNTEQVIEIIKQRYPNRTINMYPDSSGKNEKTNASATDILLLKQAGFNVYYPTKNPYVRDRIGSMNAMFCNGKGDRRYLINTNMCPIYTESLEQQVYDKNGQPDKTHDKDHPTDAAGYFIHYAYPLSNRPTLRTY